MSEEKVRALLKQRIAELMPYGLFTIWFCTSKGKFETLAEVFGVETDRMRDLLLACGFLHYKQECFQFNRKKFSEIIGIEVQENKSFNLNFIRFGNFRSQRQLLDYFGGVWDSSLDETDRNDLFQSGGNDMPIYYNKCPKDETDQKEYLLALKAKMAKYCMLNSEVSQALQSLDIFNVVKALLPEGMKPWCPPGPDLRTIYDSMDDELRNYVILQYLREKKMQKISVKCLNGKEIHYMKFPSFEGLSTDYAHLWESFSKTGFRAIMVDFLQTFFVKISIGVYLITRLLCNIDQSAAILAMKNAGCTIINQPLNAEETLGLKHAVAISESKLFEISSYLRHKFGVPILAPQNKVRELQKQTKLYEEMHFGEYNYQKKDSKSAMIQYWMIDVIATLKAELRTASETSTRGYLKIGFNHGDELGECITYLIQHDKGADTTKFTMAMKFHQEDSLQRFRMIGLIEGVGCDDYEVLASTIFPEINEAIYILERHELIVVEWVDGFSCAIIPKDSEVDIVADNGEQLMKIGGRFFRFLTKVSSEHFITQRRLPIRAFANADLEATLQMQGRANYANHRCYICDVKCNSLMSGPQHGCSLSVTKLLNESENLIKSLNPLSSCDISRTCRASHGGDIDSIFPRAKDVIPPIVKEKINDNTSDNGMWQHLLLPALPLNRWIVPILHVKLGLLNKLHEAFFEFSDRVEVYDDNIINLELAIANTSNNRNLTDNEKKNLEELKKTLKRKKKEAFDLPCKGEIEELFKKHNIVPQAYHSRTLTGKGCDMLLMHFESIIPEFKTICMKYYHDSRNDVRRERLTKTRKCEEQLELFAERIGDLLLILNAAFSIIDDTHTIFDDDRCLQLEKLCNGAGILWRKVVNTVTPKFHLFETHLPQQMKLLRNLGSFTEQTLEKSHHQVNYYAEIFNSSKTFQKRQELLMGMISGHSQGAPYVQVTDWKESRKRKFSEAVREKREAKKLARSTNFHEYLQHACDLSDQTISRSNSSIIMNEYTIDNINCG